MRLEIRDRISKYADDGYRKFSEALNPKAKPLLGVRLPRLHELARELAKGDWRSEVEDAQGDFADVYFEEAMLRGMVIGYGTARDNAEVSEGLYYLDKFVPTIGDWSVCDTFCSVFTFANAHRDETWDALQKYLYSDREFEVRAALIILLNQYLRYDAGNVKLTRNKRVAMSDLENSFPNREISECSVKSYPYLEKIFAALNREFYQGYYAQMGAAWLTAEAFVCFPYEANKFLSGDCRMDSVTYNKALQKIRESKNPDRDVKEYIKTMKKA